VLWLYQGTGRGIFAARTRIGGGWNTYTQLTGNADFTGDGRADLVARDHDGVLWLYRGTGNATSPYAARTRIGAGWNTYNQITAVGDVGGGSAGDLGGARQRRSAVAVPGNGQRHIRRPHPDRRRLEHLHPTHRRR
jgi:hypothetical protein